MEIDGNLLVKGNIQQASTYLTDTGSANAYAVAFLPAITSYTSGLHLFFKAANANTGASTINVNGLGTQTIKKNVTTDLATNDILINQIVELIYDGTNFQMVLTSITYPYLLWNI